MLFRSFAAYSHVLVLILSSLFLLLSLPDVASGAPQNVTVRFDSSQVPVSFTTGWRVAEFAGSGTVDKFAFANNPGEEVIIQLPREYCLLVDLSLIPKSFRTAHPSNLLAADLWDARPPSENVTALSYRGFKIRGGALYLVCLDCDPDVDSTPTGFTVDAHDGSDDGTQPPVSAHSPQDARTFLIVRYHVGHSVHLHGRPDTNSHPESNQS